MKVDNHDQCIKVSASDSLDMFLGQTAPCFFDCRTVIRLLRVTARCNCVKLYHCKDLVGDGLALC